MCRADDPTSASSPIRCGAQASPRADQSKFSLGQSQLWTWLMIFLLPEPYSIPAENRPGSSQHVPLSEEVSSIPQRN